MATNTSKDHASQLLKEFFSLKKDNGLNAIFYANRAASSWALQRSVGGVLLLPQLI